jgi:tRNA pseudouridine13 synthase
MTVRLRSSVLSPPPVPPASERAVGMEFYLSSTPGVAGRLKASAEAFRVREISSYPLPDPDGPFVVLRVASRGWEQHELGAAIARRLGLAPHSVQWSGTKDRRAVSDRLLSYRGPMPEGGLDLPRVELLEAYRARDGLVLGHHYGNAFEVRVGDLARSPADAVPAFRATESALRTAGGFPNFFGPQRFGEVRPITHAVGRELVRGDLARAVDVYLTARPETGSPGVGDDARAGYAEHRDPARALREFPGEYRFERTLLERLAKGQSPDRAFRALSRDLRLLFVHAYQALLFNRWVSRRHAAGLPLDRPVPGDRVLRVGRDGTLRGQDAAPVGTDNERECVDLVARGRAVLAGPLVGFDTPVAEGPAGVLLADLLAEEGVDRAGFRLPAVPELASRGAWRGVLLPVPPLGLTEYEAGVEFRFALPKGAYATVLLREFLKSGVSEPSSAAGPAEPTNT